MTDTPGLLPTLRASTKLTGDLAFWCVVIAGIVAAALWCQSMWLSQQNQAERADRIEKKVDRLESQLDLLLHRFGVANPDGPVPRPFAGLSRPERAQP